MPFALVPALALTALLGSSLMAGLLFAFSVAVMPALARVTPDAGLATMNAVNVVILNPLFLIVFMGTAVVCAALVAVAFYNWGKPGMGWLMVSAVVYLAGTLLVTMAINVPMNDALAAGSMPWADYLARWTSWNHVRTVAALVATGGFAFGFRAL